MNISTTPKRFLTALAPARRFAARREIRILIRLLAVGAVAVVAVNSRSLFRHLGAVGHPGPAWLGTAIAAEIASLLAYAVMARELLALGGVDAPVTGLLRPTLAGIAMGATLPAGVGASNVYWYKQLRRRGAQPRLIALVMTGTSVAGAVALVGLLVLGIALAGDAGPVASARTWLLAVAAAAIVLRFAFAHRLGRLLTRALRRIVSTIETEPGIRVRRLHRVMALAYANWLLDCAALYASLQAVHAGVPARSVMLVYVLGQLVSNVVLLPGGGGTVELALATGFAAFGHHGATVLAGALLYRFIGCWGLVPVGWLAVLLDPDRARGHSAAWLPRRRRRRRLQPSAQTTRT